MEGFGFAIDAIEHGWGDAIKRGQVKFAGIIDNPPSQGVKNRGANHQHGLYVEFQETSLIEQLTLEDALRNSLLLFNFIGLLFRIYLAFELYGAGARQPY